MTHSVFGLTPGKDFPCTKINQGLRTSNVQRGCGVARTGMGDESGTKDRQFLVIR
jgi:hypothetical protein